MPDSPVIAVKNIRVVEYGGKSLNQHEDTYLELRPKHARASELKKWWESTDKSKLTPMVQTGDSDFNSRRADSCKLIAEMNNAVAQHDVGGRANQHFYVVNGYISFIKNDDKAYYLACPEENCRRKVTESPDQPPTYFCEHCNKSYDSCKPTYMLLAKISDLSDNVFINFYRE